MGFSPARLIFIASLDGLWSDGDGNEFRGTTLSLGITFDLEGSVKL